MLNKISNLIVNVLINKKSIEEKDRPIYLYGAMLLLSTLAGILSIIIISLVFFDFITVLVFFIFFIPLRVHAGGYHCKKYSSCFIVSNANNRLSPKKKKANRKKSILYATIYFSLILIFKWFDFGQLDYFICVAAFSELIIVILMVIEKII